MKRISKKKENVPEDNKASENNDPDSTPPVPSSPSASIEDDLNVTNDFTIEQKEEIVQWIAQHQVINYHYFNWKARKDKVWFINDKGWWVGVQF